MSRKIQTRDRQERSRQPFPMGKSCLKIYHGTTGPGAYLIFLSSWGSRGFSIHIFTSGRPERSRRSLVQIVHQTFWQAKLNFIKE